MLELDKAAGVNIVEALQYGMLIQILNMSFLSSSLRTDSADS